MKSFFIFLVLIFISLHTYSQIDSLKQLSIDQEVRQIDIELSKPLDKSKIKLDSIKQKVDIYINKIDVLGEFNKSGSILNTEFYFNNNDLILIRFTEYSPKYKNKEGTRKKVQFYYENEKLIGETSRIQIPRGLAELGIPVDQDLSKLYGFNSSFT